MKVLCVNAMIVCLTWPSLVGAQTIDITGVPTAGAAGQIVGSVAGVNFSTHEVAAYLYIEGVGWWTKPSGGMPTVPINANGTFSVNIGTGGVDELASIYAVSVVPIGTTPPLLLGANTFDLGANSVASTHEQRFGTELNFAGRTWGVKEATAPAGPGGNLFSANSNDVWVDQDGLHLTVQNQDGQWFSTEVVLLEDLGYGTYMLQTNSRQDTLDANVVFGAFTWDPFGDEDRIPAAPNREIDFEDSRWANPSSPTNTQTVVQPHNGSPAALNEFTLPDLSADASLTRFFTWSPGRVEFYSLLGHHDPSDFPVEAVIDHYVFTENLALGKIVPEPGRENFHFNAWLLGSSPLGNQPVEVVVNDFQFIPFVAGDFDFDADVDGNDFLKWQRDGLGATELTAWQANYGAVPAPLAATVSVPEPAGCALLLTLTMLSLARKPDKKRRG